MTILERHPGEHVADSGDDDVMRIRCPECEGVSLFRHRDGKGGGFALICHFASCPTL